MKRLPLVGKWGEGRFALVDDNDYDWLSDFRWHAVKVKCGLLYAAYSLVLHDKFVLKVPMHHAVIDIPEGFVTDHRNGNTLDNRKENLRACTIEENARNRKRDRDARSVFRGVSFHKASGKWVARVTTNGRRMSLGYFDSELAAARAVNEGMRKYHGAFARLNDVDGMAKSKGLQRVHVELLR